MSAGPAIDLSRNPKQARYFDDVMIAASGRSPFRYFAYGGAIRGGKTYVTLFILIVLCRRFPGSRWHVIRKDSTVLKSTTIPSFEKLAPPGVKVHRDPGNMYAEFPNGSKIYFKPESLTQDPDLKDFLGLETNGIFLEQGEELSEKAWERAKERTGSWYIDPMPPAFLFLTFNPTSTKWVRETFYEPHVAGTLSAPYYYQTALPNDNPYVTADQWASWREMDEITFRMMVEGDWDARRTDNSFYYGFSRTQHVGLVEFDPNLPVHLSFDQNVLPYVTLTCWQTFTDSAGVSHLRAFDEICLEHPRNTTGELCDEFLRRWGAVTRHVFLYGDASGNKRDTRSKETDYSIVKAKLRPFLSNTSDRTFKSNPDVLQRREWINNVFGRRYPLDIRIGENCSNTIADFQNVATDANGHKLKRKVRGPNKESYEEFGHCSDTADYIFTKVWEREFQRFCNNRFSIVG